MHIKVINHVSFGVEFSLAPISVNFVCIKSIIRHDGLFSHLQAVKPEEAWGTDRSNFDMK